MDIRAELLREHSARRTEMLTDWACFRHSFFQELLGVFFHGSPREQQLAADVVGWAGEQRPHWLLPHLGLLLAQAQLGASSHPAVRRGIMRALQFVVVPTEWQAAAFDTCLALLHAPAEPIAIKAYALTIAALLARPYPELIQELLATAQRVLDTTDSRAFRSRAARELPTLRQQLR
ncbi:MAG: hypothetical protein ACRYFX_27385 [Janthinobacterium lividum]